MSRLCFLVAVAFVNSFVTTQNFGASEKQAFVRSKIVPDVLDVVPTGLLSVVYPNATDLTAGDTLTPTHVKYSPEVTWHEQHGTTTEHPHIIPIKFYTLVMTDPDAPSRENPTLREFLHWLVVNVPGDIVDLGDTVAEYVGAGPAKNTGLHRYVFLVYEQPYRLAFDEPRLTNRSMANRTHFSVKKFAWKYNLGEPVAGNFYYAQWDDYVPILYEQLGAGPRVVVASGGHSYTTSSMVVLTSVMMLVINI